MNPNIKVLPVTSSILFEAEDATDDRFWIGGKLVGGVLTFTVEAKLPNGDRGTVTGTEFFDAMMAHFGAAVSMIDGEWSSLDIYRANIDEFNRLTAAGVTEVDTAAQVWTGKMALRHGYTRIQIVHARPKSAKGNYQDVLARFRKPVAP